MIELVIIAKSDPYLKSLMQIHYSNPKGFVGRSICYRVEYNGLKYGAIVAGSATRFLPNRWEFFGEQIPLNNIVNNVFFHISPIDRKYPCRNFGQKVLSLWRETIRQGWRDKYGDDVLGFESLVELPRSGEVYKRDGWTEIGITKGYTCKRIAGESSDSWTGMRVWDTTNLRPKRVFVRNP